jgi:hypothetical protein
MEVRGGSATPQYGESEVCIISFSPKRGDRIFQHLSDEFWTECSTYNAGINLECRAMN